VVDGAWGFNDALSFRASAFYTAQAADRDKNAASPPAS